MLQIPVKGHEKGRIPKDAPCANHANGKNLFLAAEIRRENQELVTDILAPSLGNEGVPVSYTHLTLPTILLV